MLYVNLVVVESRPAATEVMEWAMEAPSPCEFPSFMLSYTAFV
jgi:hypothetical protein